MLSIPAEFTSHLHTHLQRQQENLLINCGCSEHHQETDNSSFYNQYQGQN